MQDRLSGVKVANDELQLSRERRDLTGEDSTSSKSSLEAAEGTNEARGVYIEWLTRSNLERGICKHTAAQHGKVVLDGGLHNVTSAWELTLSCGLC